MKTKILLGITAVLMLVSLYMDLIWVPAEQKMGDIQRIFYLMVPTGWLALLAYTVVFIGSIGYLATRQEKWDLVARASAEIGIVCTTLACIVGPIWAKKAWGVWWNWDPRLTATVVLWLIYLSYILVRSFATEESRGARFAAVVGIIGFIDVPIVALATSLWRGVHPPPLIFEGGLAPSMSLTLMISITAFTCLFAVLLIVRTSLNKNEADLKVMKGLLS